MDMDNHYRYCASNNITVFNVVNLEENLFWVRPIVNHLSKLDLNAT